MISVIGAGYVGLSFSVSLASKDYKNYLCEINPDYLDKLTQGSIPIYEENLEQLYKKYFDKKKIEIVNNISDLPANTVYYFIAVGTPSAQDGSVNTNYINNAISEIIEHNLDNVVIVIRSTVPVGYSKNIEKEMRSTYKRQNIYVVFSPEFLREGSALEDTLNPYRLVIGHSSDLPSKHLDFLKEIYLSFVPSSHLLFMDRNSAELSKYASNVFLAMKIGFINEVARISNSLDANIADVQEVLGLDPRIGANHLQPSLGYGGSCFPKDVDGLNTLIKEKDVHTPLIQNIKPSNSLQTEYFIKKITGYPFKKTSLTFGILGTSFKGGSDDIRDSSAIKTLVSLLNSNKELHLKVYDPQAMEHTKEYFKKNNSRIEYCNSINDSMTNIDALLILTDWKDFKSIPNSSYQASLKEKPLFDARNLLKKDTIQFLKENNIDYIGL